jgi:hypothetical protein
MDMQVDGASALGTKSAPRAGGGWMNWRKAVVVVQGLEGSRTGVHLGRYPSLGLPVGSGRRGSKQVGQLLTSEGGG